MKHECEWIPYERKGTRHAEVYECTRCGDIVYPLPVTVNVRCLP